MKDVGRIDFGTVRIHKKALAEIVVSAVNDIEGLTILPETPLDPLCCGLWHQVFPQRESCHR